MYNDIVWAHRHAPKHMGIEHKETDQPGIAFAMHHSKLCLVSRSVTYELHNS